MVSYHWGANQPLSTTARELGRNPNGVLAPGHGLLRVDEVLARRRDV